MADYVRYTLVHSTLCSRPYCWDSNGNIWHSIDRLPWCRIAIQPFEFLMTVGNEQRKCGETEGLRAENCIHLNCSATVEHVQVYGWAWICLPLFLVFSITKQSQCVWLPFLKKLAMSQRCSLCGEGKTSEKILAHRCNMACKWWNMHLCINASVLYFY